MEYITAPWREEYVKKVFKMKGCIFCQALKTKNDKKSFILYRGVHNFILLNKYPYTPGHLMIAPYKHLDSIEFADKEAADEMTELLKKCLRLLRKHYHPQGFNTGMNIGQCAGAGVADHYHLHIIPRWSGDSNFMPLIGKTKVFLEDLSASYDKLLSSFKKAREK
jgi:ATP adenylyltransferase